jgi:hypothetical protein
LSVSSKAKNDWVYRIFDRRSISVKGKNEQVRKLAAIDLLTNVPFGIEVPQDGPFGDVEIGKTYFISMRVYTTREISGVSPESIDFFTILDVDQSMEAFIKAYWLYPKLIKFELVELEPL